MDPKAVHTADPPVTPMPATRSILLSFEFSLDMSHKGNGKGGDRTPVGKSHDPAKSNKTPIKKDAASTPTYLLYLGVIGIALALIGTYGYGLITKTSSSPSSSIINQGGTTEVIGNKTYYPSFGLFPKDCKWRPVAEAGKSGYEYVW